MSQMLLSGCSQADPLYGLEAVELLLVPDARGCLIIFTHYRYPLITEFSVSRQVGRVSPLGPT